MKRPKYKIARDTDGYWYLYRFAGCKLFSRAQKWDEIRRSHCKEVVIVAMRDDARPPELFDETGQPYEVSE